MEDFKKEFITFMVQSKVLTFGNFTTKSGRQTPFFINTGNYDNGMQMAMLGKFYARALNDTLGNNFDSLFGPAYKGIPLAVTTAIALHEHFNRNITFSFNRKEAKDHGEGGSLVGHKYRDGERVVIIEDVITAGTSVRESIPLLHKAAAVQICALLISVDRMEKGSSDLSALQEIQQQFGMQAFAIVSIEEIVNYLHNRSIDGQILIDDNMLAKINDYRSLYGV